MITSIQGYVYFDEMGDRQSNVHIIQINSGLL